MNGGGQQRPVGTNLMRRIVPNPGLLIGGFHTEAKRRFVPNEHANDCHAPEQAQGIR